LKEKLEGVLASLMHRERAVLEMRFGLVDGRPRSLEEIGQLFSVSRERIRQIEARGLRKLRHPTRACHLEGFLETKEEELDPSYRLDLLPGYGQTTRQTRCEPLCSTPPENAFRNPMLGRNPH